jgi:HlyD family secretion protein
MDRPLKPNDLKVGETLPAAKPNNLPAVVPAPKRRPPRRSRRRVFWLLLLIAAMGGIGYWYWLRSQPLMPPGIAWGNGRLEADEVDIDTKYAGRILKLYADEGDVVKADQVIAVMDTRELEAQLKQYQELVLQYEQTLEQAKSTYAAQQAVVKFAQEQVSRSQTLISRGFVTKETLDQRMQLLNSAIANLKGDQDAIQAAQHALDAAKHQVEYFSVQVADNQLTAPKTGPIEYRVANVGEVLPAGGKVFTMLDASYVYMDIYLPTKDAGRLRIGSEARIVLDAYPGHAIPTHIVFISSQAQFTPKAVETKEERDKLMFRIRVRIDPERLKGREGIVRSGLPGEAYVRTNPTVPWPASLTPVALPAGAGTASQ